jgi:serine O-acetyltransferase
MFDHVRADFDHYRRLVCRGKPMVLAVPWIILAHPAALAVAWYRFGAWAWGIRPGVLALLPKAVYSLFMPLVRMISGVQLLPRTKIGPGLAIMHFGGVVVTGQCEIGRNCLLYHNVSLVTMRNRQGPRIGDNFYAGAGAIIIGNVIIEDDVTVGAGSVVTRSIPADCIVAGAPARFVRRRMPNEHPADNRTLPPREAAWLDLPPAEGSRVRQAGGPLAAAAEPSARRERAAATPRT